MPDQIITLDDAAAVDHWNSVLGRCTIHDIYHTAEYHLAAEDDGQGRAHLFVVEHAGDIAAFPLLLRPIENLSIPGADQLQDATSVYGYGGPVSSICDSPQRLQLAETIATRLMSMMNDLGLVSVFTRLHPLIDTQWIIDPLGISDKVGPTVIIDLSQSEKLQTQGMRKKLRYAIRKSGSSGVRVHEDQTWENIHAFEQAYEQTMQRVSAKTSYYFDSTYFAGLRARLGDKVRLFHATLDDRIIGSALFFVHNGIVQYHLSATVNGFIDYSPTPLILDYVRIWAGKNQGRWFHLGGGVEGAEDSVFRFKCGFSKERREYFASRIIIDEHRYTELCELHRKLLGVSADSATDSRFFPEYRANLPLADS